MIEVISPAGFEGFFREVVDLAAADTLTVLSSAPTGTTWYGAGSRGPGPPMGGQVVPAHCSRRLSAPRRSTRPAAGHARPALILGGYLVEVADLGLRDVLAVGVG
jgi:hypothetical protein